MPKYVQYEHHGQLVTVREDLKGVHRDHCLCYDCAFYVPDSRENNCDISNALYAFDVLTNLVTPVWECPKFVEA